MTKTKKKNFKNDIHQLLGHNLYGHDFITILTDKNLTFSLLSSFHAQFLTAIFKVIMLRCIFRVVCAYYIE